MCSPHRNFLLHLIRTPWKSPKIHIATVIDCTFNDFHVLNIHEILWMAIFVREKMGAASPQHVRYDQFPGLFAVFLKPDRPAVAASYGRQAAGGAARPGNQPRPRPFSSPNPFEFRAAAPTKRPMPFSLGTPTGLHAIPLTGGRSSTSSIRGCSRISTSPRSCSRIIRTGSSCFPSHSRSPNITLIISPRT